jgi:minichromosome maintenance protein 10
VIRLSRYGATYDVPVEGDWVTIAVVAERGEVKVSGSKAGDESDASEEEDGTPRRGPQQGKDKGTGKSKDATKKGAEGKAKKRGPRKYINLKLTSLPPRSNDRASSTQGDALLQLLLFEADAVVRSEPDEEGEVKRSYRGGSGGAYEKWCNLGVGSVIALLNPRLLRPLRVSIHLFRGNCNHF